MKTFLKALGIFLGVLFIAGVSAYIDWFHNSSEQTLRLDPDEVYSTQSVTHFQVCNGFVEDGVYAYGVGI